MNKSVKVKSYNRVHSLEGHAKSMAVDLAEEFGLDNKQEYVISQLILYRFPNSGESYMRNWAERINDGRAYAMADSETAKVLHKAGLKEYVVLGYKDEDGKLYDNYGSYSSYFAAERKFNRLYPEAHNMKMSFKIDDAYEHWHKRGK